MSVRHSGLPLAGWILLTAFAPAPAAAQSGGGPRAETVVPAGSTALQLKLDRYLAAAAASLDARPRQVLARMPEGERRALAVALYLRHRERIESGWTWTDAEARAFQRTEAYRSVMRELREVRRIFAACNPGFVLVTDTTVRSLRMQLRFWNREGSVRAAARELDDSVRTWLDPPGYPEYPDSLALARFLDRLLVFAPSTPPTVAVPGLSQHGRLRAFDFAVLHRGRVVAGTTSTTIDSVWDRGGWADRLRQAVAAASGGLSGPLEIPREPWHYEYRSETP